MKTSKEITAKIKNRVITEYMLGAAIYSYNKRAKNCLKNEKFYRMAYRCFGIKSDRNSAKYFFEKRMEYYEKKKALLAIMDPVCIHTYNGVGDGAQLLLYSLFYELGPFSFHYPVTNPGLWPDLEIYNISAVYSPPHTVTDLMSTQCANKILNLVRSGDYTLEKGYFEKFHGPFPLYV